MRESRYIQVLLPLRLKWEPFYSYSEEQLPGSLAVGDRVRVEFGGKEYVAVVTVVDVEEEAGTVGYDRIKPIIGLAEGLDAISKEEINLWMQLKKKLMIILNYILILRKLIIFLLLLKI